MWGYPGQPGYPVFMMPPPQQQQKDPYEDLIKKALKQSMRRPKENGKGGSKDGPCKTCGHKTKKKLSEKTFSLVETFGLISLLSLPVSWAACHIGIWMLSDIAKITAPFAGHP